jgi:protease-4
MSDDKSWQLLEKAVLAGVQEQRRSRRWGILFKSLTFLYLFAALALFSPVFDLQKAASRSASHTALIEVRGVIADEESASADNVVSGVRAAFEDPRTKGVILRINSPGGSPVQSSYIFNEVRRLRAENPNIKVYAVIADIGASGAYYVASAADEIYADKSSLVGSIGVTASGFGFVGTIEKLGIDRRMYTSGQHKGFLDPFQPQKEDETLFWQGVLDNTHRQFIESVRQGRGDRLKAEAHPELFSGLVWSGEQALALGLVDGIGSSGYVARELVGEKSIVDFTVQESLFDRFSNRLGASIAQHMATWMGFSGPVLR